MSWPTCPPSLKEIKPLLNIAEEHDGRDIVVAYWARVYALQVGLKLSTKQPDEMMLLLGIMDWLEATKQQQVNNESITNEIVAQAHVENYAFHLFQFADKNDRNSNWHKNVVKAFYTSSIIYDVMQTFGELSEEVIQNRKYAKWKASYIHNCLKNGITPIPGPVDNSDDINNENKNSHDISKNSDEQQIESTTDVPTNDKLDEHNINNDPPGVSNRLSFENNKTSDESPIVTPIQPKSSPVESNTIKLTADQMTKAQTYCKYASSALNYDDTKTAIDNLEKALALLKNCVDN